MRTQESSSRSGFTLIEILVAIAVLVVVILICGQAFQAASAVARKGEASGDALQEAWTVKRQIEDDLSRINPDGALV
ncbi:MAG: prepilin-type N-terminal cleavage/methylation domain-containing protein, partial [Phycisphaerae bacterium]|nr:prepilin-type N-terminal cleavage/methylation domain-containing protein [Phycisphaerae bacterium]